MKAVMMIVALLSLAAVVGCHGQNAYRSVDLDRSLTPSDVERYRAETQTADGPIIEYTNNWLLGMLIYWHRGMVTETPSTAYPTYEVSLAQGFGPLSLLYSTETHATYDRNGRRLSGDRTCNLLAGLLVMSKRADAILANGHHQQMSSTHLIMHHLINRHTMDGHTTWSLLSMPNPLSVSLHDHDYHMEHHDAVPPSTTAPPTAPHH